MPWEGRSVNWAKVILDEFQTFNQGRMRTIHYDVYIMRILKHFDVPFPDFEFSTIGALNTKTLGLMNLPKQYRNHTIITYEHWHENQSSGQARRSSRPQASRVQALTSSQPPQQREISEI